MPYTAAIFDLDGVIVDTAEFHYLAWKRLADEIGIPFDRDKNELLKGVPRLRSLEIIIEGTKASLPEPLEILADRKNGYYVEMVGTIKPGDLLCGVGDFLKALRNKGIATGIASSSKNARRL